MTYSWNNLHLQAKNPELILLPLHALNLHIYICTQANYNDGLTMPICFFIFALYLSFSMGLDAMKQINNTITYIDLDLQFILHYSPLYFYYISRTQAGKMLAHFTIWVHL